MPCCDKLSKELQVEDLLIVVMEGAQIERLSSNKLRTDKSDMVQ